MHYSLPFTFFMALIVTHKSLLRSPLAYHQIAFLCAVNTLHCGYDYYFAASYQLNTHCFGTSRFFHRGLFGSFILFAILK